MNVPPLLRTCRTHALRVLFGTIAIAFSSHGLAAQAKAPPPDAARRVSTLDFANAKLADVIRTLATMLGRTVIMSDIPDVRVTFATPAPLSSAELERILESLLESHELMLVPSGAVAQILPTAKAPATGALRTGFTFPDPPPLGLVTQLVPLQSIRADEGADALRALTGKGARIETVARSNALLITDRGANIARYLELLRTLDAAPAGESGLRTYVVNLKYAAADDLAGALGQLYGAQVANSGGGSLADRSLSRALDAFRTREAETFRTRNSGRMSGAAALAPSIPDSGVDLFVGTGGSPEAVLASAALKCLGGDMQSMMWPRDEAERKELIEQGYGEELSKLFYAGDLAQGPNIIFCATGISDSPLLRGVRVHKHRAVTQTVLMRAKTHSLRYIETHHELRTKKIPLRSENRDPSESREQ